MIDIKNKKIFVTGGEGFIGSHLVKLLTSKGANIKTYDMKKNNKNSILDMDRMLEAMNDCNYVIHLAATIGVGNTEKNQLLTLNTNILGTKNVLDCCISAGIKKIVFSSSSEVYGEQIKQPIEETNPLSPKSSYGIAKLASEEYIKAYNKYFGLNYSIVRLFNAYGPEQRNNFVVSKFVNSVLNYEPPTIYGNGSQIRSFCYVDDIVNGIYLALVNEKADGEIFNIGNNKEPISIRDLAIKVMKLYGRMMPLTKVDFKDSDRDNKREIFVRVPDITKARNSLGYEPKVMLDEGIKKTIEHWEERV